MPDHWYYSWQHPRSKRCHLLDYVITRRVDLADVRSTRAMRGADCSTDHYPIVVQPPYQANSKEIRTNTGEKTKCQ